MAGESLLGAVTLLGESHMIRPKECQNCVLCKSSTGFVPDTVPDNTLFAMMLRHPGKNELIAGTPIAGWHLWRFEKMILDPLGIDIKSLLITNTIRCYPHDGKYPTGKEKIQAGKMCTQYAQGLEKFRPDTAMITYSPFDLFRDPNTEIFIYHAFKMAKKLAAEGKRVLVLGGNEAKEFYYPNLHGGMKRWQRSFWPILLDKK